MSAQLLAELKDRNAKIDEMKAKILEGLEEWAFKEEILLPGETLYFTLEVVKQNSERKPDVREIKKGAKALFSRVRPLTGDDWKLIFSPEWRHDERIVLELLKKRKNKSLSYKQFMGRLRLSNHESLNIKFRNANLPYRILCDPERSGRFWQEKYFLISVMPSK